MGRYFILSVRYLMSSPELAPKLFLVKNSERCCKLWGRYLINFPRFFIFSIFFTRLFPLDIKLSAVKYLGDISYRLLNTLYSLHYLLNNCLVSLFLNTIYLEVFL